jgi:hypothetical protein
MAPVRVLPVIDAVPTDAGVTQAVTLHWRGMAVLILSTNSHCRMITALGGCQMLAPCTSTTL